jgi:hypothetical protein
MVIRIVVDKDLNEFERKFTEIGMKHKVLDNEFFRADGLYWMRLDCED